MNKQQGLEKGHSVTRGIVPLRHNCGNTRISADTRISPKILSSIACLSYNTLNHKFDKMLQDEFRYKYRPDEQTTQKKTP